MFEDKRRVSEQIDSYNKKNIDLVNRRGLSKAFLRPVYKYTSLENRTIEEIKNTKGMAR